MPGWSRLLSVLIRTAESTVSDSTRRVVVASASEALNGGNLPLSASLIRQCLTKGELDLAVRQQFDLGIYRNCPPTNKKRMTERLRYLVAAPWAGIITTNYDELIEHALAKWSDYENHRTTGTDNRIGSILANCQGGQFFVKLHGTVAASQIVLSTEEYDRMYLGSPQVSAFLTAVMLSYHLVFIGCSLEDEIVRLRRKLSVDFGGVLPMAYAVIVRTRENTARAGWLRDNVQVESVFYEETDKDHVSLDHFLRSVARSSLPAGGGRIGVTKTAAEILRQAPERRLREIGAINRTLLMHVFGSPKHTVDKAALLDLVRTNTDTLLNGRTPEEIMYRIFFLVSLNLLEERISSGMTKYIVPSRICVALKASPP